jgi:phosphate acetyltransferase
MQHTLFLAPSGSNVGLTSVALGVVRALDSRGVRVAFFKPIGQCIGRAEIERSTHFVRETMSLRPTAPLALDDAERLIIGHHTDELMSRVVGDFHRSAGEADLVVVEGLVHTPDTPLEVELNQRLIQTLSAEVILVGAYGDSSAVDFVERIGLAAEQYTNGHSEHLLGVIANRVLGDLAGARRQLEQELQRAAHGGRPLRLLGAIPESPELAACRTVDVVRHLDAEVLHEGEMLQRRVKRFTLLARTVPNLIHTLTPGAILVTPCDRSDVILAVAMAVMNKIPIAGLFLTGAHSELPLEVLELCKPAFATGLPVLRVGSNSWETVRLMTQMSPEIPTDDLDRVQRSMSFVAEHINADLIARHSATPVEARLSPAAFCYRLTEMAKQAGARIVLPEGTEPRTVRAAAICAERGIARCVLLGDPYEVRRVASGLELTLPEQVEILDPSTLRHAYVGALVDLRRSKGMTEEMAAEQLEDNVWLGTMMLARGEVDGLVSGAVHSTANTIRPALQVIKTKPDARVVSSIFFMCLPEQVVVYGDCAVNPDPDIETLADIAIQSADSARAFGIVPRVAMLSYSTGDSGSGSDVDKVREATRLVQQRRPDLVIDGPLQYDAAAIAEVGKQKAPNSPVAGQATVFVFPDLNTGNTTYKAVQRSANVISIGPMLQGMNRPVNDLSRGALVEDIVYTIAITAVQARQG